MTTKCLVFIGYLFICYITLSSFLQKPTAEIVVKTHANGEHILHPASTRGHTATDWLESKHTFSFNDYYNEQRMNFGALRVLNDDRVNGGYGFGKHRHDNMEIISIPLEGTIEHQDNLGNKGVIKAGDVQIMSAGTGIVHAEYNHSKTEVLKFLQIWVVPNSNNLKPRYQQLTGVLNEIPINSVKKIIDPEDNASIFINQDVVFSMGRLEESKNTNYQISSSKNGAYLFVLEREGTVNGIKVNTRDGIGIWNTNTVSINASSNMKFLLMDVPMN